MLCLVALMTCYNMSNNTLKFFLLLYGGPLPKHNIPRVPSSMQHPSKNFMCFMYRRRFCNRYFQIWGLVLRSIGWGEGLKIRKVPVTKLSPIWIWNLALFFNFLFSQFFCSFSLYVLIIIKAIFWDTSIALSWQMERISQGTMTSAWGFLYFRFFQSKISILIKLMMVALKRKPNFVNN